MKIRLVSVLAIQLAALVALPLARGAGETTTATAGEAQPRVIPVVTPSPVSLKYGFGVQNMTTPDVDSNTFGVNAFAEIKGRLPSGIMLELDATLFLDFDQDHLDPHHTPLWLQAHFGVAKEIWQSKTPEVWHISWIGDVDNRANTTSSIERDLKLTRASPPA
jgi:hypothetical protein